MMTIYKKLKRWLKISQRKLCSLGDVYKLRLAKKFMKQFDEETSCHFIYKNKVVFMPDIGGVTSQHYQRGIFYEMGMLEAIRAEAKSGTYLDVGANIRIYALIVAKNLPNIKIDAFEPHIGAFERMEANIRQNGFSKIIQSHNLALSNENKKGYLLASTRFGTYQSGGASISPEGEMKISQVRGDDLIKDVDSIIAIKIDVEGFELSVLQGTENLIKNNKIFLQIEIFDEKLSETSKFLEDFNFKLIEKGTFTHQDTVKDYFYINF